MLLDSTFISYFVVQFYTLKLKASLTVSLMVGLKFFIFLNKVFMCESVHVFKLKQCLSVRVLKKMDTEIFERIISDIKYRSLYLIFNSSFDEKNYYKVNLIICIFVHANSK
jgi:hypothetical protein